MMDDDDLGECPECKVRLTHWAEPNGAMHPYCPKCGWTPGMGSD